MSSKKLTIQPFNSSTVRKERTIPNSDIRPVDFSASSNVVIRVEELWKQYRLGTINHGTLAQDLNSWWAKIRGKEDPNLRIDQRIQASNGSTNEAADHFWALRDVSFDVKQGEALGIIGKNGAGKSTLLKILSQVTAPTKGQINIKGRIASLLEVGTGFHPDLTGRENVFLNGAILGMSKHEIRSKFDEIVAFAEIDKFIDTPVKRYSSGMYVRLAFAVAAHLEPEILIIDEVLAVGDVAFQRKCLGKMSDVASEGRTVLFVSHNMTAMRNLCGRVSWLCDGKVTSTGATASVIDDYLRKNLIVDSLQDIRKQLQMIPEDPVLCLHDITIYQKGQLTNTVLNGSPVEINIHYEVKQKTSGIRVYFDLCDEERNILVRTFHDDDADSMEVVALGTYISKAVIPEDLLAPRAYELRVFLTIYNVRSVPNDGVTIPLYVEKSNGINRAYPHDPIRSKLLPRIDWQTSST
jgi:lipopolysaccharide transport system ATP-binding protein